MEPGPGVGGPGPGVIPPAGSSVRHVRRRGRPLRRRHRRVHGRRRRLWPMAVRRECARRSQRWRRDASRYDAMRSIERTVPTTASCRPATASGCDAPVRLRAMDAPVRKRCPMRLRLCRRRLHAAVAIDGACVRRRTVRLRWRGLRACAAAADCTACSAACGHGCDCGRGRREAYADGGGAMVGMATSQIAFLGDDGVQVSWDVSGSGMFDSHAAGDSRPTGFLSRRDLSLEADEHSGPRRACELYPTLEVAPVTPRTDAYLAHSPIPVQFTEEDFDQVAERQLCDQGDLPARSGVPGARAGRRRNARQHAARSGRRSDCRGRSPRFDPGDRADGQQGFGSAARQWSTTGQVVPASYVIAGVVQREPSRRPANDAASRQPGDLRTRSERRWQPGVERRRTGAMLRRRLRWRRRCAVAATAAAVLRRWRMAQHADGHADGRLRAARRAAEHDRRRAAMGHADHRHADRPARSAARAAGRAGRFAEARDEEPHARAAAAAGRRRCTCRSSSGRV